MRDLESSISSGDGPLLEDRISRDSDEDASAADVGGGGLTATVVVVMVVVVVVVVPVKKKKKRKKKRKKKTADILVGAALLCSLAGGDKATLKDRGDVVLAGTRRVFVHVARKDDFSIRLVRGLHDWYFWRRKGEGERRKTETEEEGRKKSTLHLDRQKERKRGYQTGRGRKGDSDPGWGKKRGQMVRGTGSRCSSSGSSFFAVPRTTCLFQRRTSPIALEHLQCDTIMRIKRAARSSWPREPEEVPSLRKTFRETQRQE